MSKKIRVNINLDNNHSLVDFPVYIYSGSTTGNTTNLVYADVTESPVVFEIDDDVLSFGLRLVSDGCLDQIMLIDSPRVDCEICADFVEYFGNGQPTPEPTSSNPTFRIKGSITPEMGNLDVNLWYRINNGSWVMMGSTQTLLECNNFNLFGELEFNNDINLTDTVYIQVRSTDGLLVYRIRGGLNNTTVCEDGGASVYTMSFYHGGSVSQSGIDLKTRVIDPALADKVQLHP